MGEDAAIRSSVVVPDVLGAADYNTGARSALQKLCTKTTPVVLDGSSRSSAKGNAVI